MLSAYLSCARENPMYPYICPLLLVLVVFFFGERLPGASLTKDATEQPTATKRPSGIPKSTPGTPIGLQYETWFTPHNAGSYETAEAVPVLGKYSSYDKNVIVKHEEWFEKLGIDWLLLDWSNVLWMKPEWEKHAEATQELEETTDRCSRPTVSWNVRASTLRSS